MPCADSRCILHAVALALVLVICQPGSLFAGEQVAGAQESGKREMDLQPGAYEITYRLELPHVDLAEPGRRAAICIVASTADLTQGLGAVSDNNPLARCQSEDARRTREGALAFTIVCPGANAARGEAVYQLQGDRFEGRIAMRMGGKNMTMTETQSGNRTGTCPARGR